MQFRTVIKPLHQSADINYNSNIITIGSCFSDNIGNWLKQHKFNCSANIFGTVFNPVSIASYFKSLELTTDDLININEVWVSLNHHSQNNKISKEELILHLSNLQTEFKQKISEATHLIITLGTAWVYKNKENNKVVANCHKIPQNHFKKELLSIEEIVDALDLICQYVPDTCNIIFTLSPVRHVKDGFIENSRSKARLLEAIHQTVEKNRNKCLYYPAYEIFIDDLRDYRFYEVDLIHPATPGLDYIKEHFAESFFSEETIQLLNRIKVVLNASNHKLFNPLSKSSLEFKKNTINQIKELQNNYPFIDFSSELAKLN